MKAYPIAILVAEETPVLAKGGTVDYDAAVAVGALGLTVSLVGP